MLLNTLMCTLHPFIHYQRRSEQGKPLNACSFELGLGFCEILKKNMKFGFCFCYTFSVGLDKQQILHRNHCEELDSGPFT